MRGISMPCLPAGSSCGGRWTRSVGTMSPAAKRKNFSTFLTAFLSAAITSTFLFFAPGTGLGNPLSGQCWPVISASGFPTRTLIAFLICGGSPALRAAASTPPPTPRRSPTRRSCSSGSPGQPTRAQKRGTATSSASSSTAVPSSTSSHLTRIPSKANPSISVGRSWMSP